MTAPIRTTASCPECGAKVPTQTPFSDWLRALPEPFTSARFSNQNLDYIWHEYRDSWLITIEEKRHGAGCPSAQSDTHSIVKQLLTLASGSEVHTQRGRRSVEYRGHYVVIFSHTTPDDSDWIKVNGKNVTRDELMRLLNAGSMRAASPPQRLREAA